MKKFMKFMIIPVLCLVSVMLFACGEPATGNDDDNDPKQGWYFEEDSSYGSADRVIKFYGTDELIKENFYTVIELTKNNDDTYNFRAANITINSGDGYVWDKTGLAAKITHNGTVNDIVASMMIVNSSYTIKFNTSTNSSDLTQANITADLDKEIKFEVDGLENGTSATKKFTYTIAAGAIKH